MRLFILITQTKYTFSPLCTKKKKTTATTFSHSTDDSESRCDLQGRVRIQKARAGQMQSSGFTAITVERSFVRMGMGGKMRREGTLPEIKRVARVDAGRGCERE
jgi:hypothetical protein